jgi:YHS domain-containing protein
MFNLFKKKCPICKMELREGGEYPEGCGKKFCSEECREEYRKKMVKEQSKSSCSCCH